LELPSFLYRSGEAKHMKSFLEEGEILFRPLTYYRNAEDGSRRDELEGKWQKTAPLNRVILTFRSPEGNFGPFKHQLTGDPTLTVSVPSPDLVFVSCFTTDSSVCFGESKVKIHDVPNFLSRICNDPLLKSLGIKHDFIRYYSNESTMPTQSELWRQKRLEFSNQQEFRLTFTVPQEKWPEFVGPDTQPAPHMAVKIECGSFKLWADLIS
jgi:hypothetical protein